MYLAAKERKERKEDSPEFCLLTPEYLQKKNIRQRLAAANDREEVGHCEGDLIVSGQGTSGAALLTIVDRKSRYAFMEKLKDKTQESVMHALGLIEQWINNYPRRILNYASAKEVFEGELSGCQA